MSENLDPREVAEFNRNMQELNSILPGLAAGIGGAAGGFSAATKQMNENAAATKTNTNLAKARADADKEAREASNNMKEAMYQAKAALGSFTDAIMKNEVSFSKFNTALGSAGDAAVALGKNFGTAGLAIGTMVKGLTLVTQLYTKQADAVLKASDEMSQMGTAGQLTSKEILDMAHGAGLYSGNLEILTKTVKSIGTGMMSLGSTVGEGTKEFAKITAVSAEQRAAFQRLGLSQEDLMKSQGDYISLQAKSGMVITDQMKQGDYLKKASLEYTQNLLQLSAVTGKNVEDVKKEQAAARAEYNFRIKQTQLSMQAADLEKEGKTQEAAQVRERIEANNKLLDKAIATGDKQQVAAIQSLVATESITEQSAVLLRQGQDTTKLLKGLREGKDVSAQYEQQMVDGTMKNIKNLGNAMVFSEENAKKFGIAGEGVAYAAQRYGKDLEQGRKDAKAAIGDPSKGTTGKKIAEDPAQKARNELTNAEIKAKVAVDKLVASANPLISGLNATTIALTALAAAAYAAIKGLGAIAAAKATGAPGGPGGPGAKGASVAKAAGKTLGMGAVSLGLGMAAENQAAKGNTKTAAGLDVASTTASYAAMGSIFGPVGTLVAGSVGLAKGLYDNREALFGSKKKPSDLLEFTGKSGTEAAFNELSGALRERVMAAAEEYFKATGKKLTVNSAKRSSEDQQRLWDETVKAGRPGIGPTGMAVGQPGKSKHEQGEAIDIQQGKGDQDAISAMGNQGLVQTVAGDPVHFELPKMADGGIVSDPTVALIGEGGGPEVVTPLKQDSILMELAKTKANASSAQIEMVLAELMKDSRKITANTENLGTQSKWDMTGAELGKRMQPDPALSKIASSLSANTSTGSETSSGQSELMALLIESFDNFSSKLDSVKDELSELNDGQNDILKYSKV